MQSVVWKTLAQAETYSCIVLANAKDEIQFL